MNALRLRHLQSATGEHELRRSLYEHSSSRGERLELTRPKQLFNGWSAVARPAKESRYASRSTHWKPCPSNLPRQAIAVRRPLSQRPTDAQREAVARREGAAQRSAARCRRDWARSGYTVPNTARHAEAS